MFILATYVCRVPHNHRRRILGRVLLLNHPWLQHHPKSVIFLLLKRTCTRDLFFDFFVYFGLAYVPYTAHKNFKNSKWNSRSYSYLKIYSALSTIGGVVDSAYRWYGESLTPCIVDAQSRLSIFFLMSLGVKKTSTPRIVDTGSRRLRVSMKQGVDDSPHR